MGMPMHAPSLAETTAFVAVVELKSFTKAAKQLALSPPRVSEMVRNIEERLGVRLVERTTRSVAPTAAGERLLERLRPVLDEYQSALESTKEFRGKPAGMLRVTAPPPAGDFFLGSAKGPLKNYREIRQGGGAYRGAMSGFERKADKSSFPACSCLRAPTR